MTTPQSGREAFSPEAIAAFRREKGNGMTSAVGEYTPPEFWDALDEIERLQAALAQQGREVGEPVAWIHKDGRALLLDESMHRATNPADWNPLYTAAPKQKARMVGCETDDGLIVSHPESEVCAVCAPKQQAVDEAFSDGVILALQVMNGAGNMGSAEYEELLGAADAVQVYRRAEAEDMLELSGLDAYVALETHRPAVELRAALLAALPGKTEVDRHD